MSFYVDRYYFYRIEGRELHLYKLNTQPNVVISQTGVLFPARKELVYPDEDISDGLRIEYAPQWDDDFFIVEDPEGMTDYPSTYSEGVSNWEALSTEDFEDWDDIFGSQPTEDTSPDATTYLNLSRRLTLAVIDFLKAQKAEFFENDIKKKEYYMKEFFNKLRDHESNKRKYYISFPVSPYAVR